MTKAPNKFTFTSEGNRQFIYEATLDAAGYGYNVKAVAVRTTGQPYVSTTVFGISVAEAETRLASGNYKLVKNLDPANGFDAKGNPLNFTEADLKEGMRVKVDGGEMWIVTKNVQNRTKTELVLVNGNNGWDYFGTHFNRGEVEAVYENNEYNCYQHNPEKVGALIWQKDDAAKEAAKAALAEKVKNAEAELAELKKQQAALV